MPGETPLRAISNAPRIANIANAPRIANIADYNRQQAENYLPPVGDLLAHTTQIEFLVPGAIPRGNIVLVSGAPFSGKTWICYDLARAVASGTPWLGRGGPAQQGPVVILNYDQPTETMGVRIRDIGITADMPVYVHTFGLTKPGPGLPEMLILPSNESRLKAAFEHIKPSLIIVDALRQAHNLDENSNKDMAAIMAIFKRWQRFNNTTVVLIHHTVKGKDDSQFKSTARGSGELSASSDVELSIEEKTVKWTKSRAWNIGDTKHLTFGLNDSYSDAPDDDSDEQEIEVIKRVNVRSMTPLPGELEAEHVGTLVEAMKRSGLGVFNYGQIKNICTLEEVAFKKALRNARVKRLVKYVRQNNGAKVYRLMETTSSSSSSEE